ncbi:MAG: lipid-A-disaccharide synthase, partial [Paracoccaceae bacterium]
AAQGLSSLFDMSDLSVMGMMEILPRLPRLLARIRMTVRAVDEMKPDALVTIDSPEFCLRVAKKARETNPSLKTIHYVAPSVWAWRAERAAKMAQHVDHVLALLPFEPPYMEAQGMGCDFVGHPIAGAPMPDGAEIAGFRASHGIGAEQPLLVVLPGSRMGEVARLEPIFAATLREVLAHVPDLAVVVPAAEPVAGNLKQRLSGWPVTPMFLDPRDCAPGTAEQRKRCAFAAADLALAASGTVSLELAAMGTPMVIAYRFNWLTTRMVKRKVRLDTATLVNILTGARPVPEFLLENCRADLIAPTVIDLLGNRDARDRQIRAANQAMEMLGRGGDAPGLRAARAVLNALP